jgi:hypothetical protein
MTTFFLLSEVDPAPVRELLVHAAWERAWSEDVAENYFAWRYAGARGIGYTLVACDQGRCVGILDSRFCAPIGLLVAKKPCVRPATGSACPNTGRMYPRPAAELEPAERDAKCGVRVGLIARDDNDEAWRIAHAIGATAITPWRRPCQLAMSPKSKFQETVHA